MKARLVGLSLAVLVMLGFAAYWELGTGGAPLPDVHANEAVREHPGVKSGVSASASTASIDLEREEVAANMAEGLDVSSGGEPGSNEQDEVMRRYEVLLGEARDLVTSEFPTTILPESRRPAPEIAQQFCDEYLELVRPIAEAEEAYYDALSDQVTSQNLALYERPYPVDEPGLEFRDAVRAGVHPRVRLAPGEHLISMSETYMILPAGNALLEFLHENVKGTRKNIAPRVHSLIVRLR